MDVIASLEQTFAHAARVVAGVRPDQHGDKTPCAEWTVRDLLEHMIGVVAGLGAAAAGQAPSPFVLGDDPAAQFDDGAPRRRWRRGGPRVCSIASSTPGRARCRAMSWPASTCSTPPPTPGTSPPPPARPATCPSRRGRRRWRPAGRSSSPEIRRGRFGPEQSPHPPMRHPPSQLVAFLGRTP